MLQEKAAKKAAFGTTRFQSRSFEAWHKAGAVHLFPVDPRTASYEERPYMQRRGGSWEGKDLDKLGLKGRGQGKAQKRLELDDFYEKAKKEGMYASKKKKKILHVFSVNQVIFTLVFAGRLDSASIFGGANLPWTAKEANKLNNKVNTLFFIHSTLVYP